MSYCYAERKRVYEAAIAHWGINGQMWVAAEELSELIKEVCKLSRGQGGTEETAEEIADVSIMLEQLMLILDCGDAVEAHKNGKISRLRSRLENEGVEI